MDPITMIVIALAAGAAAGLKPTAEQAIKDAYAGVKAWIQSKYAKVDLTPLERKPESEAKRESVREDLADAGAGEDQELLDRVNALLVALEKQAPETAAAIGIDLKEVKAAFLRAQKVIAEGTGVKVEKSEFSGGIDLGEVQAGKVDDKGNP
ncbi:MAG TPA: hypothetical protein VKA60_20500 [Blastocatellia bacterium]|nr:hypothetical protein [Blastocatellia bacterium]